MIPVGLSQHLTEGDTLIIHEGWTTSNLIAGWLANRCRIPYVVLAHGVYAPEIRHNLRWGKVRTRFERRLLERASAVHVFFEGEVQGVVDIAPNAHLLVAPTGVREIGNVQWEGGGGYIAWMGRFDIHHKGLDILVRALAEISPTERPTIEMRGPDHRGDKARLCAIVAGLGLAQWINVGDELRGADRWEFYRQADAVVHPARWESYGQSIVEAMVLGAPVLVSKAAQISSIFEHGREIYLFEPDVDGMARGLRAAGRADLMRTIAENGRIACLERLSWKKATDRYVQHFTRSSE
ncbi:hypothetical protein GCM10009609_40220 [Pseudonocardia aurantiaca]